MRNLQVVLLVLLGLFGSNLWAADKVVVATDEWSSYTNKDGTGYYFDVLRAVFPAPEYELEFKLVPYARSLKMVNGGDAHVVLGIYEGEVPQGQISKWVVEQDLVDVLLSPDLAKSWKGVESLAGKNVVAKIDYSFDTITDVKMNYSEKASIASMVKMLQAGRVDAVLDYEADLKPVMKAEKLGDEYKLIKSVMGSPIYFGFSSDAKGKQYLARFNQKYKELWDSKKIHEIMEENVGETGSLPKSQ